MIVQPFAEPSEAEAPDLIQPVVAFRSWQVIDGRLRSPYAPVFWNEPILSARCTRTLDAASDDPLVAPHRAPSSNCTCGIYGCFSPDPRPATIDYRAVTGIVTMWGAIEVHAGGMRAEHAKVEALALYSRWTNRQKHAVWCVAERLELDLIDLEHVDHAAERYGARLPRTLLPTTARLGERAALVA